MVARVAASCVDHGKDKMHYTAVEVGWERQDLHVVYLLDANACLTDQGGPIKTILHDAL
jgi:hypothetical protein